MWNMIVKNINTGRVWEEPITTLDKNYKSKPIPKRTTKEKAKEQAENLVAYFNSTLREGESPRELIAVSFVDESGFRDTE